LRRLEDHSVLVLSLLVALMLGATRLGCDARSWSLIANTLRLIAAVLIVSVPPGVAVALLLFRTDVPLRRTAGVLLAVMLIVPLYLQAAAWEAGFGPSGWFTALAARPYQPGLLSGWRGAVWIHALAAIPWIVLIVGLAVRWVEPELEETALLNGSLWRVFTRVTLRRALPAVGLAAVWIALSVATEMTVTDLFQTETVRLRTYAEEIYTQFAIGAEPDRAPPGALIGAAVTGCLAACGLLLCRTAAGWRAPPAERPARVFQLGRWRWVGALAVLLAILLIFVVPLVSLIAKAGIVVEATSRGYVRGWSLSHCAQIVAASPARYSREIGGSVAIAAAAATLLVPVALLLGWLARKVRWTGVLPLLLAAAALAVPGPLLGVGLIALFNRPGWPLLNFFYDRTIALPVLAQAIRAFPLVMFILWHALDTIPDELPEAAQLDGAGSWSQLLRIALPLRWPAAALAWLGAFIVAIGELSATILVVPPGVQTLGVRIAQLLHFNIQNELAGLSLVLMLAAAALAAIVLGLIRWTTRRSS
jgi:iron(III) transport system permease protein